MERLTVTVQSDTLHPAHLPARVQFKDTTCKVVTLPLGRPMSEIEREVIRRTLQEITSHREKAAGILGISPRALHYKLKRYGLLDHGE